MENTENKKKGLESESLGIDEERPGDKPKSYDDQRPADLDIPKGDHTNTDTSRGPADFKDESNDE